MDTQTSQFLTEEERGEIRTALEESNDSGIASPDDYAQDRIVRVEDLSQSLAPLIDFPVGVGRLIEEGTGENDLLTSADEQTILVGLDGNDTLQGGAGSDFFYGGAGNDVVQGGAGNDYIVPSLGNDTITGGGGDDFIQALSLEGESISVFGDPGNDAIIAFGSGDDILSGGDGRDRIAAGKGMDTIEGGNGSDLIHGSSPVELAFDFYGASTIEEEDGSDLIRGQDGDDFILGGAGEDSLLGGDGNDTLSGFGLSLRREQPTTTEETVSNFGLESWLIIPDGNENSSDFLRGGAGADTFVVGTRVDESFFDNPFLQNIVDAGINLRRDFFYDSAGGNDRAVIEDFNSTEDRIQLRGAAEDYVLDVRSRGTSIALDQDNNGVFNSGDEELAFVRGSNNLDLNSVDFSFV